MFDHIAPRYDMLNHVLSAGIDRSWRKKLVKEVADRHPKHILDVATGTADLAVALAALQPISVTGIDISENMIELGQKKVQSKNLSKVIRLMVADSEQLPFSDSSFDLATVAFGVRNFENLEKGLSEIFRVIREGGSLAVLEFSIPERFPVRQLYLFYFRAILPLIGRIASRNETAYSYLPASVREFAYGKRFENLLLASGFQSARSISLSLGIATLYIAQKLGKPSDK